MKKKRKWHQEVIEKRHQNYEEYQASQDNNGEQLPGETHDVVDENDLEVGLLVLGLLLFYTTFRDISAV